MPASPLFLRDGRVMHRFHATGIPAEAPPDTRALLDRVRRNGVVLVADGMGLHVVERWKGQLHRAVLRGLRDNAGDVVALLRKEHRVRVKRLPPEAVTVYDPAPDGDGGGPVMIELAAEQRGAAQSITDAVGCGEQFALFGLAGTGKTTVAAHMAAARPGAISAHTTKAQERTALLMSALICCC
jgi:hypothetical protein